MIAEAITKTGSSETGTSSGLGLDHFPGLDHILGPDPFLGLDHFSSMPGNFFNVRKRVQPGKWSRPVKWSRPRLGPTFAVTPLKHSLPKEPD